MARFCESDNVTLLSINRWRISWPAEQLSALQLSTPCCWLSQWFIVITMEQRTQNQILKPESRSDTIQNHNFIFPCTKAHSRGELPVVETDIPSGGRRVKSLEVSWYLGPPNVCNFDLRRFFTMSGSFVRDLNCDSCASL